MTAFATALGDLWARLEAGGPLMAPIAIVSFASWYWTLALLGRLRRGRLSATELAPFRRELGVLRALVAAAPLLGLLGTVRGMVGLFAALGERGTGDVARIAAGISEAILTTQVGLVVALPGIVGASAIARRVRALELALLVPVPGAGPGGERRAV